jgi:hypothetical protein
MENIDPLQRTAIVDLNFATAESLFFVMFFNFFRSNM